MREPAEAEVGQDSLDAVAADLQKLRIQAGEVSYAEIARRIGKLREIQGADPLHSRPARTTIYDAFRPGRRRINVGLVGEIAIALGCSDAEAKQWQLRCIQVRSEEMLKVQPAAAESPALEEPACEDLPAVVKPCMPEVPEQLPVHKPEARLSYMLMAACLLLNILGYWFIDRSGFPLYLDMIGTAISAILYGPWVGAAVGLLTNLLGLGITGESSAAFGLVNVAGALVWGFGSKAIKSGNIIPKFVFLNIAVAVTCSLIASFLLVVLFGGTTGHGSEVTMNTMLSRTNSLWLAVFNANIMYSLVDKLLTGFVALTLIGALDRKLNSPLYRQVEEEVHNIFMRDSTGAGLGRTNIAKFTV